MANNKDKWGLALDGQLKHEDTNLASSTLYVICNTILTVFINLLNILFFFFFNRITDPTQRENLGIIVQYKVKVKLCITPLGGYVKLINYTSDKTTNLHPFFFSLLKKIKSDLVAELPFILMNPKPDDIEDIILNDSISTNNHDHEVNSTSEEKQSSMGNNKSSIVKEDVPNLIQLDG